MESAYSCFFIMLTISRTHIVMHCTCTLIYNIKTIYKLVKHTTITLNLQFIKRTDTGYTGGPGSISSLFCLFFLFFFICLFICLFSVCLFVCLFVFCFCLFVFFVFFLEIPVLSWFVGIWTVELYGNQINFFPLRNLKFSVYCFMDRCLCLRVVFLWSL